MNRREEMDQFIKFAANYINKTDSNVDEDLIYVFLENYGFTKEELIQNNDLSNMFLDWIDHFSNNPNLNVYHDVRQKHFLQFRTDYNPNAKHVKLYFTMNPESMPEGVNQIFDFIAKNNIQNASKVANKLRSDSIVLRIDGIEDAEKVIEYINNNEFLTSNARLTNPFMSRAGKVGVAYDDCLSYNSVVSYFIFEYIKSKKGLIKKYNVDDFLYFIADKYNKIFVDESELNNFCNTNFFQTYYRRIEGMDKDNPLEYTINNFKEVLATVIANVRSEEYRNVFNIINNKEEKNIDKKELLDSYIKYAYEKYQDKSCIIRALTIYINGDKNAITRDNNFRNLFVNYLNKNDIVSIVQGRISDYIDFVISDNKSFTDDDFNMFIKGCKDTYIKYGYNQLLRALTEFSKGNFQPMTNDNNCRSYFKSKYSPEQLAEFYKGCVDMLLANQTVLLNVSIEEQIMGVFINKYGFDQTKLVM